jgi:hypothetical protein
MLCQLIVEHRLGNTTDVNYKRTCRAMNSGLQVTLYAFSEGVGRRHMQFWTSRQKLGY